MRLPKKVIINNIPFKVKVNRKSFGSSFSYKTGLMSIGAKGKPCEILEGYLHEVMEVSAVERGIRGTRCNPSGDGTEYVFSGNHKDFADMVTDVSIVVADLMKLE